MRRFALTLVLCSLLVAGCGDEDEPSRTVTAPANAKLRVIADEYSFDPATIVLKGAGTLTLTVRNEGSLAHNLRVFRADEEIGGTPTFPAGRTESARVNLEHGSYEMICTVGDHAELGMRGTLQIN